MCFGFCIPPCFATTDHIRLRFRLNVLQNTVRFCLCDVDEQTHVVRHKSPIAYLHGHGFQASTHGTVQPVGHMFFWNSKHRLEVLLSLAFAMRLRAEPPSMQKTPCIGFPFFECSPRPTRMPSRRMVYAKDRGVPWVTK